MHLSTRSKVSVIISLLSILTIVSAFMLSGVFSRGRSTYAASPGASSPVATTGTLAQVGTVDPMKLSATKLPRSSAVPFLKGVRSIHTNGKGSFTVHIPSAASSALDGQPAGKLLRNFNGVGSLDSANTNFGLEFEPPDQGLCVGNGFVVEPVNSAFTIYRTNGSVVAGPFNVNLLYDEGPKQ
jgi:hypothetical protein